MARSADRGGGGRRLRRLPRLSLDFDVPVPSPQQPGIQLDLSAALVHPVFGAPPLIRFAPRRWSAGYS